MIINNILAKLSATFTSKSMTRDDFMNFFRDDDKLNTLSVYDRLKVFRTILPGGSELIADLFNPILDDYNVEVSEVVSYDKSK